MCLKQLCTLNFCNNFESGVIKLRWYQLACVTQYVKKKIFNWKYSFGVSVKRTFIVLQSLLFKFLHTGMLKLKVGNQPRVQRMCVEKVKYIVSHILLTLLIDQGISLHR